MQNVWCQVINLKIYLHLSFNHMEYTDFGLFSPDFLLFHADSFV